MFVYVDQDGVKALVFFILFLSELTLADILVTGNTFSSLGHSDKEFDCKECKKDPSAETYPVYGGMFGFPDGSEGRRPGTIQQTSTLLGSMIDNIPDKNLQNGLREYLKIVKPEAYGGDSVGGSNKGLNSWFSNKFSKNQCYRSAAQNFYRDVAITMKAGNKCEASASDGLERKIKSESDYGCFNKRPSITDTAGKGSKSYLHEGWMWQLAMKHARGSPEAAMELIGMCGHDDTAQSKFQIFDDSVKAKEENTQELERYKKEREEAERRLKKAESGGTTEAIAILLLTRHSKFLLRRINELKDATGKVRRMDCPPQESDFYLPGSIGTGVDIPQDLKNKISKIQNPSGKNNIPAKNYHIYGAAFLGCKMAANGLTPIQATAIQKQAARLYRGVRMCEMVTLELSTRQFLSAMVGKDGEIEDSKKLEGQILAQWKYVIDNVGSCARSFKGVKNKTQKDILDKACDLLHFYGINGLGAKEIDVVKKKIAHRLGTVDAALLYKKWYFGGGTIFGKTIPCTDIRYRGPKDLMNPDVGILSGLSKPSGWSDERYKIATQRLATWDVDFEWTIKQHEVGSSYGASICKPSSKTSPFKDEGQCLKPADPTGNSIIDYDSDFGSDSSKPVKSTR